MLPHVRPELRSRNWVFTLNNYTEDDVLYLSAMPFSGEPEHPVGVAFSREVAPTTGTPHLQGFMHFKNAVRPSTLHSLLQVQFYVAPMRGRMEENEAYCSKANSLEIFGEMPKRNEANGADEKDRWDEILQNAKDNKIDSIESKVVVQHYRTLKMIAKDYMKAPEDLDDVCGIWIFGPSGVGKSRLIRHWFGNSLYDKLPDKWFDGYQGEAVVHVEDLDVYHVALGHFLKRWADRYSFHAEIKGSAMLIRPQYVCVTSQYSISEIFGKDQHTVDALARRFKVYHIPNRLSFDNIPSYSPNIVL